MRFASPQWLWGLILIVCLAPVFIWELRRRRKMLESFAKPRLWPTLVPGYEPSARKRKLGLWLLAACFSVLALARPQWGVREEIVKVSSLDIVIALDLSNSMETEDVVPNRLKKAQHVIRSIAERLSGDRLGIVAFADGAYPATPLTNDLAYVLEVVQGLSPRSISNQGTDIGTALEVAARALSRGAEQSGDRDGSKVVVLISDGEDLEERALEGAKALEKSGVRLYVLGVGTEKGGPIPVRDDTGTLQGYRKDAAGQGVVSRFRPQALMQLAESVGGKYWDVTPSEQEVDALVREMGALDRKDHDEKRKVVHQERYQIPLAIAVLFLLLELSLRMSSYPLRLSLR